MFSRKLRLTFVLLAAMITAGTLPAMAQSENGSDGLVGTWRVQVTLENCATHVQLGPTFQSLLSFHRGGTMNGTTLNPAFLAGQRSPDFGSWAYAGSQNYTAASEAYIMFNGGPFVRGTQRISQAIHLDGNAWTALATVQFFDINHNQTLAACALANATRFD